MVPMVFVYSPAMLMVIEEHFSWGEFIHTTGTCIVGIVLLGASLTGYLLRPMSLFFRLWLAVAAIMMVVPSGSVNLWAVLVAAPVLISQIAGWHKHRGASSQALP